MSKKFLSFLGGGYYKKCIYKCAELPKDKIREYNTYFIQEALTEIFCNDWTEEDEVVIFLTERAKKENWIENPNKKIPNTNTYEHRDGLKHDLLRHNYKFGIKEVNIKDGNNIDEIWENFDIIIKEIEDGDEIIFDITHAFRYIPILALTVLNYAKSLKNIKVSGIYYGNYEYRNEGYNNPEYDNNEKPIMNLIQFDEILEWSQAVDSFVKYGNSDHIKKFANEVLNNSNNKDYYKNDMDLIKNLVNSLNDFTNTIATCRGRNVSASTQKNSITVAYKKLNNNLNKYMLSDKTTMKPLEHIIGNIQDVIKDFEPVENREEIINTGLAIVKWSLDNNLIQQAYTALLETMISYMCILEGFNYNSREDRAEVKKIYDRIYNENKNLANKYINGNLRKELARLVYKLGIMRNDINHFGYSFYESDSNIASRDYTQLKQYVENSYKLFKDWIIKEEKLMKTYSR